MHGIYSGYFSEMPSGFPTPTPWGLFCVSVSYFSLTIAISPYANPIDMRVFFLYELPDYQWSHGVGVEDFHSSIPGNMHPYKFPRTYKLRVKIWTLLILDLFFNPYCYPGVSRFLLSGLTTNIKVSFQDLMGTWGVVSPQTPPWGSVDHNPPVDMALL